MARLHSTALSSVRLLGGYGALPLSGSLALGVAIGLPGSLFMCGALQTVGSLGGNGSLFWLGSLLGLGALFSQGFISFRRQRLVATVQRRLVPLLVHWLQVFPRRLQSGGTLIRRLYEIQVNLRVVLGVA